MTTAANVATLVGLVLLFLIVCGLGLLIGAEEADKALAEIDFDRHCDTALTVADWRHPLARYEIAELEAWLALPPAVKP